MRHISVLPLSQIEYLQFDISKSVIRNIFRMFSRPKSESIYDQLHFSLGFHRMKWQSKSETCIITSVVTACGEKPLTSPPAFQPPLPAAELHSIFKHALWWISRIAVLIVCLTISSTSLHAKEIRFATMRLGTSWYVFGATLYKLMRNELPNGVRMEIMAKGGGVGNPILVERDRAQIAIANRATAVWAVEGNPLAYSGVKHSNLRALVGGLNPVWVSALVRKKFLEQSGLQTLEEILAGSTPVRIVMKPRGSSVPVVADMILEALGTNRRQIVEKGGAIIQVGAQQIPTVLRNGRADLYLETTPKGHPTVTEVTLTIPMQFLDLPDRVINKLAMAGLQPVEFPASFKGQNGPTKGVDLGTVIITNTNLSDDLAYRITKTVCENRDALAKAHKAWSRFQPEQAWRIENTGIRLHPGAERYYRERGWLQGAESQPVSNTTSGETP